MDVRYRSLENKPGEILASVLAPNDMGFRYADFVAQTGLQSSDIVLCNTVVNPFPVYPGKWNIGPHRWNGLKSSALWHPMFWIPESISSRSLLSLDSNSAPFVETDELWAMRMALTFTASGLYNEADGTWVDVLCLYGLDIDNPAARARVDAWLAGSPDPVLDAVDLSEHLTPSDGDSDWVFAQAWAAVDVLRPVAWVVHADALLRDVEDLLDDAGELLDTELAEEARVLLAQAQVSFSALSTDFGAHWWRDLRSGEVGDRDVLLGRILPAAEEALASIRAEFWPQVRDTVDVGAQVDEALRA